MAEFDDLLGDSDYKALAPEQQYQIRRGFFQQKVAQDDDFKALSAEDKQRVTKSILFPGEKDHTPGLLQEGKASDALEFAGRALSRLAPPIVTGDTTGLDAIQTFPERHERTSRVLGDKGTAAVVEGARGLGGLMQPFIPRALTDLLGEGGEAVKTGAKAVGLPEPAVELAPDLAMTAVLGLLPKPKPAPRPAPRFNVPVREAPTPIRRLADEVPAGDPLLMRQVERQAIEREAIQRAIDELTPTSEQTKTTSLLDAAAKTVRSPEPEGNPTLRAAQENVLKGQTDTPEPVALEQFRKAVEDERAQPSLEREALSKRLQEIPEQTEPLAEKPIVRTAEQPKVAPEETPRKPIIERSEAGEGVTTTPPDLSKAGFLDLVKQAFPETGAIGQLTPEQVAAERQARAVRAEIGRRVAEKAAATGETFEEAGKSLGLAEGIVNRLTRERSIDRGQERLASTVEELANLNKKAETLVTEAETIQKTGTIGKEFRTDFREEGKKPQTFGTKFSEKEIFEAKAKVVGLAREIKDLHSRIEDAVDPFSRETAKALRPLLDNAITKMNEHAANFRRLRFAAGRAVKQFDRAVPEDVIADLRDAGVILDGLRTAKDKLPIWTSIADKAKRWNQLTSTERSQFGRDLVDNFRLGIFGLFSFSRDILSNAAELAAQQAGGVGRDLVRVSRGDVTFPSLQAMFRAIERTKPVEKIKGKAEIQAGPVIESALRERIAGGERLASGFRGERGVFTMRSNLLSKAGDYIHGTPLYLKSVIDTGSKRFSATRSLWEDAITEANRQNLKGLDRRKFFDNFFQNPPSAAIDRAISEGNKAGFNRQLSPLESRIAGNKFFQLVGEGFARWPFQFTRWAGEMLGGNPELFKKVKNGTATLEDIGGYLGKTATGLGGVYLVSELLYDNVDFNNMSYIHANGERTPLSNLEPITSALFLVALLKGDIDRATAGVKYASVPFGRFLMGEGGILGSFIDQVKTGLDNGKLDPDGAKREIINTLNRAIPGQGVLSAIKAIYDPTTREGIGGNLPTAPLTNKHAIDRATGQPQQPNRRLFGVESPRIGALAIPGATVIADPVTQLFARFGILVNRGKRQPIAGIQADEIPEGLERQYTERLGQARQRIMGTLAKNTLERLERNPELLKNPQYMDSTRKLIQKLDAQAARIAKASLDREAGAPSKLPRRPTIRERRGPVNARPEE